MSEPRRFSARRRARLSECGPDRRVRYDALACWLQDIASDDVRDVGLTEEAWLVRRIHMEVRDWPRLHHDYELVTWASGAGGTVAERRTTIGDGMVEATALWVCVDRHTIRPVRLSDAFFAVYGSSLGDTRPRTALVHPDPPAGSEERPWPLRHADLDWVDHVNNAAYLAALEELCAGDPPTEVEIEYRGGLTGVAPVTLVVGPRSIWFVQQGEVGASIAFPPRS